MIWGYHYFWKHPYVQLSKHALIQTFHGWQLCQKVVKTVRSDGTPSKAIPPLLNVHVYFAKACRCRVAIPQASKLAKTVASDGTPSKQPSSFRHVTSLDGRTYDCIKLCYLCFDQFYKRMKLCWCLLSKTRVFYRFFSPKRPGVDDWHIWPQ